MKPWIWGGIWLSSHFESNDEQRFLISLGIFTILSNSILYLPFPKLSFTKLESTFLLIFPQIPMIASHEQPFSVEGVRWQVGRKETDLFWSSWVSSYQCFNLLLLIWVDPSQQPSTYSAAHPLPFSQWEGKRIGRAKARKLMVWDYDNIIGEEKQQQQQRQNKDDRSSLPTSKPMPSQAPSNRHLRSQKNKNKIVLVANTAPVREASGVLKCQSTATTVEILAWGRRRVRKEKHIGKALRSTAFSQLKT